MDLRYLLCGVATLVCVGAIKAIDNVSERISASISLKVPGNEAKQCPLTFQKTKNGKSVYQLETSERIPLTVYQTIEERGGKSQITVCITALEDVYFNCSQQVSIGFHHNDCQSYIPGFWYRHNLRSPKSAPSLHTSDSQLVREDRLSTPLTGIYSKGIGRFMTVNRIDRFGNDALAAHREGEVILSGKTSLGFTSFENRNGIATLPFGLPYQEAPENYIRELTLAPQVKAFQLLKKGKTALLNWIVYEDTVEDYSDSIRHTWEYCYGAYTPKPVDTPYSIVDMKNILSSFFASSLVSKPELAYYSGVGLRTDDCKSNGEAEVDLVGRVLLNVFNAWEYGWENNRVGLKESSLKIFDSYLKNGFTEAGFFKEFTNLDHNFGEPVHSIRRQSGRIYAMLHFLAYGKEQGRHHPEWEQRMKKILDMFMQLQNQDDSFPRRFRSDFPIVDKSGGSTPSATLPLVMGYRYFRDKCYLDSVKKTMDYLESELISKADYFPSTLDANYEGKEASPYAATTTYYLALIAKGEEHKHYADLTKKTAYFALLWYYLWDVPFTPSQMLGDIGLEIRGRDNVSVENNHIDVFILELASALQWLSKEHKELRFADLAEVTSTSMRRLLPYDGYMRGIAKVSYYPEVIQHMSWNCGRNGKGYYSDIFAPGWTVTSLWELLIPGRAGEMLVK